MPAIACQILEDAATGLLYTLHGNEATIVGSKDAHLTQLHIPACIGDDPAVYPVTAVGESAFAYHPHLALLEVPGQVNTIRHSAFEGTCLTEVTLQPGVRSVGPYAFYGCRHLTRVTLPTGATLEEQAFGGCTALTAANVVNLADLSDEALRRAGLPACAPAAPVRAPATASTAPAVPQHNARFLLEKGLELETAGDPVGAAAAYMEAHRLRAVVARTGNALEQAEQLRPIDEAEYHLALLLKFDMAPVKDPDGSPRPGAAELLNTLVETTGNADAAYHLADMYAGPYGLTPDRQEVLRLLRLAAKNGHERACLDLGYLLLEGKDADPTAAGRAFTQCAGMDGPLADIARLELRRLPRPLRQL